MRDLNKELKEPVLRLSGQPSVFQCILDDKKDCCRGKGYLIDMLGQFTRAELCECILNCQRCFGRSRVIHGQASKPCRPISPHKYVNAINNARLPSRYGNADFLTFKNLTGNNRRVLDSMKKWCAKFQPQGSKGLIVGGTVGVGKTYLLASLAREMMLRGYSVRFVDFFELLVELRAGYSDDKSDSKILKPLIDVDILIIDEMGKGRRGDWEVSILDQLVMGRYNQKRIIVASTNYGLKNGKPIAASNEDLDGSMDAHTKNFGLNEMESLESRIDSRIFSRLSEISDFIEMTGDNFRSRLSTALRGFRNCKGDKH